ncbi:MAG: response regulator [SAR324 cluster bacterium]|nr:response regulator [SAR324 cluster bacterium]
MKAKPVILVVDDTPENIHVVMGVLKEKYKVKAEVRGASALEVALKNPPDLILLDIMMPEMDGFETCQKLKEFPETQDIPIIFLTAKVETQDIVKGFELGAVDYLTKPFNPAELEARIHTHLQLQMAREQLVESEKMAALGHLVAGIAHEINTPFGAIKSSIHHLAGSISDVSHIPKLARSLSPEYQGLFFQLLDEATVLRPQLSTREARQQRRAISRKLETLEITNASDLAEKIVDIGIEEFAPYTDLLKHDLSLELFGIAQNISRQQEIHQDITTSIERVSKLIFALKSYAGEELNVGQKTQIAIENTIETVLTLYHSQIQQGVEVIRQFESVPLMNGCEEELVQVWTNLIHNSLQAMCYRGTLEIQISSQDSTISVDIIDSGHGIPEDIQEQVFNPFYTTKPPGEGAGLGLDITQRIVTKHKGKIQFESQAGKTRFTVTLPC